ncbi:ATP-dependent DNA ligase [Candidatus Pacearchaeota archaeon]|nr:ATP-dependent DNA ligase [Candidatus Pacearchaeota archaeon]
MLFSQLTETFERLEATTKRLEMFDILSDLLKETNKEEIDKIIYLLQEHILPSFYGLELGLAEKMVEKAIAKASNTSQEKIEQLYKKKGDFGLVAEEVLSKKIAVLFKPKAPTIDEVYQSLSKIAKTSGEGSSSRKIEMLTGLLISVQGKDAKYIIRFVLGSLRLGVGDPTIMDSLSKVFREDRTLRGEIEKAYNLCSDLGLVAKTLYEKGEKGIKDFKAKVFSPIRMALAERLPNSEEIIKKIGKCAIETKYDGLRIQWHLENNNVEIFSRNLERMTHMFPDLVKGIKEQIKAKSAIGEGEAVAFNEETGEFFPFQVTITRKRKYDIEASAKDKPLVLFSFDLLYLDGKDFTGEPYLIRKEKLAKIIKKGFTIREAEKIITDDPKKVEKFFEENIEKGTEGIMAKRLDSPYQAGGRNFNWIKLKRSYKGELKDTVDLVIIGYFKGKGMRAKFGIGALLGAAYDKKEDTFKSLAKIGSGLSEEKWVEIRKMLDKLRVERKPARVDTIIEPDVYCSPKYVFTVMADEITKSPIHTAGKRKGGDIGYALRFPRIQGWVRDKNPEDATDTDEIISLFKMQTRVKTIGLGK